MSDRKKVGKVFWENVCKECSENNYSFAQLESYADIYTGSITNGIKNSTLPRADVIEKIATTLDVDYYILFIDEDHDSYGC